MHKLTRKERVLNLIRRKPVDRTPCDIWLSDRAATVYSQQLKVALEELAEIFDNHLAIAAALDNHKTWENQEQLNLATELGYFHLSPDGNTITDDWGVVWDKAHEGIYAVVHPMAEGPDLKNLRVPSTREPHLFDPIDDAVSRHGQDLCVVGCQDLTLFERACALRGFEAFLIDLKENPHFADRLLDHIADHEVELAKEFVSRGVDMAFTGGDYGSQQGLLLSVEDWLHFEAPRLERIWAVYRQAGVPILHHSCGKIEGVIPHLIRMGLDVLNPIQHIMAPEGLRKHFGGDIVMFGGVDSQNLMQRGSRAEIVQEVKRYIDTLGGGRGYIAAPDQCVMSDVPLENVLAFVEAVRDRTN